MPCFSCSYFSENKGRNGESLDGGRGFCEFHDEEYWNGHECRHFSPTWYSEEDHPSKKSRDEDEDLFDLLEEDDEYLSEGEDFSSSPKIRSFALGGIPKTADSIRKKHRVLISLLERSTEAQEEAAEQTEEYIYCTVSFDEHGKTYYYKTDDETLKRGDTVIVPYGKERRETVAKIMRVQRFSKKTAPFPPEKTKTILGKVPE